MATPKLAAPLQPAGSQPGGLFPWDQGLGVSMPSNIKPLEATVKPPAPMDLPPAKGMSSGMPLESVSSIPLPGQDSLPDDFSVLEQQLGLAQPEKPGILKSIGKGILDIALQPARGLEQLGKYLGTLGLSPEQRKKVDDFLGPGFQETVSGSKEYATPTPTSGKQAAGIALKSAANLSVPFGTSLPAMALQGAAYAGGEALEKDRPASEVAFDAAMGGVGSAALGSLLNVGGAVIGRGFKAAAPEISKAFKGVADKLGPMLTGTSRKEFDMAFKDAPHILLDYLNVVKDAGTPAEAEGILQNRLVENVRSVVKKATGVEGTAFKDSVDLFNKNHPDVTVDIHAVGNRLLDKMPQFGLPRNADEEFALNQIQKIIQKPREYTVNGARTLLQDLWSFADGLDAGSPAERLAKEAWADVRQELSKATSAVDGGAFDAAMARYAKFKETTDQLKQLNSSNEDTVRSFVRNLSGTNKTASREALIDLQKMAGVDEGIDSIDVYRLMKKLAADGKVTGSRVQDVLISGGAVAGLGALGALFGPAGAGLGHTLGVLLAAKTLAPSTITSVMLSEMKAAGIPVTNEIRKALEQAIKNPAVRQGLINAATEGVSKNKEPLP